jgi:hypothetical protein
VQADSPRIQRQGETYRWLILNEALCPNDDGIFEFGHVEEALRSEEGRNERFHILGWVENAIRTHDGFMTFLMGTHRREVLPYSKENFEMLLNERRRPPDFVSVITKHLPEDQQLFIWNNEQKRKNAKCVLQHLSGHPGIRQNIADLLGVARGRELRIMRQLASMLRNHLEEMDMLSLHS